MRPLKLGASERITGICPDAVPDDVNPEPSVGGDGGQDFVDEVGENDPIISRIVAAVSERTRSDPTQLDPLYDVIDTDALEVLVAGRFTGCVEFQYAGCFVTVEGDGRVRVTPDRQRAETGEIEHVDAEYSTEGG